MNKHPLATMSGIKGVLGFLLADGALCPACGHGTRATSNASGQGAAKPYPAPAGSEVR